ncbi:hypothetical protein H4R99_001364 [Coemansia sp. RSA 1722]|nr:hypothetical protein LPJ57_002989 [Coemansia sp. RSA 486]KAJ2231037.1 hypothetical protein IWW45_005596 [Coemansia sp. RSA 485]KAJ2605131.1 hypothetical protein H4R99_001364 [Coemansia sp. RSA 1722]
MLRMTQQFADPIEQKYLFSWIRERFHFNKRQTSRKGVELQFGQAQSVVETIQRALSGSTEDKRHISDLAYGRTGWLKHVVQQIREFHHPTKTCDLIRDVRPLSSRLTQPHEAYWIPLDQRVFSVPPYLLERQRLEDEKKNRREKDKRRIKRHRLSKEIAELTAAVNKGNRLLADSGLVPGAFSVEPSVSRGPHYVPGILGNPAWIPPKIKNRMDPPFVQHVRASIGCEFYVVNSRKPPHWLSAKIAAIYRTQAKRVIKHEFYYYLVDDLKLEEEFEERLGIEDRGYWIYARNYRDFLRTRIKNFSLNLDSPDVQNEELDLELRESVDEYQRLVTHAMELQFRDSLK